VSVTSQLADATAPVQPARRRPSRRLLALLIVGGGGAVLGVGALADTLAVAPLRPPTHAVASQRAGLDATTLSVSPEPLTAGQETAFTLQVSDVTGAPVNGAQITCDYTMPAMPMPTMLVAARADGGGRYICEETLSDPGAWALSVTVTMPGASAVHTVFALQAR
jgi:YtkA-like protein